MLSRVTLLSRTLCVRAPLALTLPLQVAHAPACSEGANPARLLHVFARRPSADYAKVEVRDGADAGDLKKAVMAELQLDAPSDCVRLLREAEGGGAPVLLDSRRKLAAQGVSEGTSFVVEVALPPLPSLPPALPFALPPPLDFVEQVLGGEAMMVADLQRSPGIDAPRPFYLTLQEHSDLADFLRARPSDVPQMLVLVGPIKCGKTRLVHTVIPRLLAARAEAAAAPRPVPFSYTFPQALSAELAAQHFVGELLGFARDIGIAMEAHPSPSESCLDAMPRLAAMAAVRVHARGGELWLLLDELGAPIVASSHAGASRFTEQLKDMISRCSPYARVVGTGSGMVALLTAINAARPNGFVLSHAVSRVNLGREPAPPAALAMAQAILAAYAHKWAPGVAPAMTPQAVLALLARSAQGGHTSPRPALVAYLASIVTTTKGGSAEEVLRDAIMELLAKLRTESARDTATALLRMPVPLRRTLHALAVLGRPPDASASGMARFVAQLCEAGSPLRLLPPYGALLRSWIASDGSVAVSPEGDSLDETVWRNLAALSTFSDAFSRKESAAASEAVLHVLSRNGVGAPLAGGAVGDICAPTTVEEVAAMPAVQTTLRLLDAEAAWSGRESRSSLRLRKVLRTQLGSQERALFIETAGLTILLWVRNVEAHVFFESDALPRSGLSGAVIKEAVKAALEAVTAGHGAVYELDDAGVLCRRRTAAAGGGEK